MFSAFFIHRPVFAGVISIVIVLLGAVAISALPIARYPEIAPPSVQVSALYPGADARTVAETVAAPIEREVNGVDDMIYMSSTSASDGSMTLTVTFEVGTDPDLAAILVQNRVSSAEPQLPEEVKRQGVTVAKKSTEITALITLTSDDPRLDALFLSNYGTLRIQDELLRVPGVGDVFTFGAAEYGMRVWLDPSMLDSRGLTVNDVLAAIRAQNVQVAAGQVGAPPSPDQPDLQLTVNTRGRFTDVSEFEQIVIKRGDGQRLVQLRDVARIELGAQNYSMSARADGSPAAVIAVYQLPGANAIDVVDGIDRTITELAEAFPDGMRHEVVYRSTNVISASIREVIITLLIAIVLVIATVYVFLQSFRATLIPAVTIPVALVGTFAVMLVMGFSINLLTLFGLVLAIGIVVDDAIVVVENTTRHLDESSLSPRDAALRAMGEVSGPVIATTLVLLAVFVPTAFIPGISGLLFQQFSLTIAIATVFSSINALTLSPALAAIILRPTPAHPLAPFRAFNWFFDRGANGYAAIVRLSLRLALVGVPAFAAVAVAGVLGLGAIPSEFVPQEDEGWAMINVQLPEGASLRRSQQVMERITAIAEDTPGIATFISIAGYSIIDGAAAANTGVGFVIFEDWSDRPIPEVHQSGIIRSLNRQMASILEAQCVAFPLPSLPGLGNSGGLALMVEDRGGVGLEMLEMAVQDLAAAANADPAVGASYTTFRAQTPQVFVDVDREAVQSRGVSLSDVNATIGAALGGAYANDFTAFGRIYQVRVQAEAEDRAAPSDIERLKVRNADGQMIPLAAVASVQEVVGARTITRFNVYPAAKLINQASPVATDGQVIETLDRLAAERLPSTIGAEWTELAYQQKTAGGAGAIFILAVILVYLVLAAQYESWTLPVSVCMAVPTALLGAALGLLLRDMPNSAYGQIGVVLLIGLSAKSSILIVEFAKELRSQGRSTFEAALEAARVRFRAILMTAFSFILGVLPLLVASGAGAESRKGLGTVVFGGMLVATIVGLLVVPMLYFAVQRISERIGGTAAATDPPPTGSTATGS